MTNLARQPGPEDEPALSRLDRQLLDAYQRAFPLSPRPFAVIARALGVSESWVIERFRMLQERGYVVRIGPVFRPRRIGASTLAAMAVPPGRLAEVAELVNGYDEVNHNYERDHTFNLWFVVTAPNEARLRAVLTEIEERTGLQVLDLPMEHDYHIDLGFPLWC